MSRVLTRREKARHKALSVAHIIDGPHLRRLGAIAFTGIALGVVNPREAGETPSKLIVGVVVKAAEVASFSVQFTRWSSSRDASASSDGEARSSCNPKPYRME